MVVYGGKGEKNAILDDMYLINLGILFYFILFYFILFYFILFYFILLIIFWSRHKTKYTLHVREVARTSSKVNLIPLIILRLLPCHLTPSPSILATLISLFYSHIYDSHSCLALTKDEMVLIGGITKAGILSNDIFIFSLSMSPLFESSISFLPLYFSSCSLLWANQLKGTKQWTKVNVTGEFAKREMHTAIFTGSDIWVYGGKGKYLFFCSISRPSTLLAHFSEHTYSYLLLPPHLFSLLYVIDEFGESLSCTRLVTDFLTLRFYEVLPRYLALLVLSFLGPMDLTRCLLLFSCSPSLWSACCLSRLSFSLLISIRFGQACKTTHEFSEDSMFFFLFYPSLLDHFIIYFHFFSLQN